MNSTKEEEKESDMKGDSEWQAEKNLSLRLSFALHKGRFTDCSFVVGPDQENTQIFYAHKLVLSSSSSVFAALFYGPLAKEEAIAVQDSTPAAFEAMLNFIYSEGNQMEDLDVEVLLGLLYLSDKYQIEFLKVESVANLTDIVDKWNVCSIFNAARLFSLNELEETCWDQLEDRCKAEICLPDLNKDILLELLDCDELGVVSELELFHGVENWVERECERQNLEVNPDNMQKIGRDVVKKIRFLTIPSADFVQITSTKLLTRDEKLSLLTNICSPEKIGLEIPMPDGFCLFTKKRVAGRAFPHVGRVLRAPSTVPVHSETIFKTIRYSSLALALYYPFDFCISSVKVFDQPDPTCFPITLKIVNSNGKRFTELIEFTNSSGAFENVFLKGNTNYTLIFKLKRGKKYKVCMVSETAWNVVFYDYHHNRSGNITFSSENQHGIVDNITVAIAEISQYGH